MVARETPAVAGLIRQYQSLIRAAVAHVLGRRESDLGDEVTQQVAEALLKRVGEAGEIEHPATYLYRCAVRETVRLVRRQVARGEVPLDGVAEHAACGAGPDDEARHRELAAATERVLGRLAPERAAAARAHLAGFTVEELMTLRGWSYQKARNLIARGMADLRAGLREEGHA